MLKVGKLTDYGTLLMTALAAEPGRPHSAHELALRTHVAGPTVSKLLKRLTRSGLVESLRGAHGGYRLARPATAITVADIIAALEGPFGLTQCATHRGCTIESSCGTRTHWHLINEAIRASLQAVTLAQMALPARPAPAMREFPLLPAAALQQQR